MTASGADALMTHLMTDLTALTPELLPGFKDG